MTIFINVEINRDKCQDKTGCYECVTVCPVDIFKKNDLGSTVNEGNMDECTLCNLCLDSCVHNAIEIVKNY